MPPEAQSPPQSENPLINNRISEFIRKPSLHRNRPDCHVHSAGSEGFAKVERLRQEQNRRTKVMKLRREPERKNPFDALYPSFCASLPFNFYLLSAATHFYTSLFSLMTSTDFTIHRQLFQFFCSSYVELVLLNSGEYIPGKFPTGNFWE